MNDDLERQLVDEYPDLYRWYDNPPEDYDGPLPQLTAIGFQHGDGWYHLLEALSETLDRLDVEVEAVQIKEKFGGLRYYHNGVSGDDEQQVYMALGAIRMASDMSFHVCEECGAPGERRGSGWLRVRCDDCYETPISRD